MGFELIPAIDLMNGEVVRLEQGDANRRTRYDVTPAEMGAAYEKAGIKRIHVVDLDGAFAGESKNLESIREIRKNTTADVEVGGGVRDRATIVRLLDAGANYVVIGTKALEDPEFLKSAVSEFGEKVIVGADARNGFLSTRGWTVDTEVRATTYLKKLREKIGISTVIFTDISRDGMFTAPNYDSLSEIANLDPGLKVIASGGVGTAEHIRTLSTLNNGSLLGVIVGKALYDGRLSLEDAIQAAGPQA